MSGLTVEYLSVEIRPSFIRGSTPGDDYRELRVHLRLGDRKLDFSRQFPASEFEAAFDHYMAIAAAAVKEMALQHCTGTVPGAFRSGP